MMLLDTIKFFRIKLSNTVGKGEIWSDIVLMTQDIKTILYMYK